MPKIFRTVNGTKETRTVSPSKAVKFIRKGWAEVVDTPAKPAKKKRKTKVVNDGLE